MTKYREILRLYSMDFSERNIALSCSVSRNTVSKVISAAQAKGIAWPLDDNVTDAKLKNILFPKTKTVAKRRMPDFEYIRKELQRNGVSKKLLWTEYLEECRLAGDEPLMYSHFCYYVQKEEEKRRATMRIPRKPGEQIEVDWAGDPGSYHRPGYRRNYGC